MTCRHCGAPMAGRRRMYCDSLCRNRAAAAMRGPRTGQCSVEGCDRPHRARTLCSMHYRRWERSEGRATPNPWSARRKSNWKKRYALKHGAPDADRINPAHIFERDAWTCQLCGDSVDKTLRFPHPQSASLDHVQPLSVGGTHTLDNVQLAHFRCNASKGNREHPQPTPVTR